MFKFSTWEGLPYFFWSGLLNHILAINIKAIVAQIIIDGKSGAKEAGPISAV